MQDHTASVMYMDQFHIVRQFIMSVMKERPP
jgi:hypothetical protein